MELVFQVGTQRHRESKDNDLNPTASKQKSWVCLTPKPAGVPASRPLPQLCGTCPQPSTQESFLVNSLWKRSYAWIFSKQPRTSYRNFYSEATLFAGDCEAASECLECGLWRSIANQGCYHSGKDDPPGALGPRPRSALPC